METSKKASAQRQTEVAIALFRSGHLDCAITLSAAAEGMLPNTDAPFLFAQLRQEPSSSDIDFNLVINWLKHSGAPETAVITEFEATWIIARAITKFYCRVSPELRKIRGISAMRAGGRSFTAPFREYFRLTHYQGVNWVRIDWSGRRGIWPLPITRDLCAHGSRAFWKPSIAAVVSG